MYRAYPAGQPQVSVLRIFIPPHSRLSWHEHPVINAAYVLSGELTVEKRADGSKRRLRAGEAMGEMVHAAHRGYTGDQSAMLLVFYAGAEGVPLSIPVVSAQPKSSQGGMPGR
ncbi:cupin domain-containing protein [Dyella sp.]|uniref:cupin domain-containing protein n=1 Tax=Dyella sp. TaxID=1869338 RepID=UPI002ED00C60